jgi:tetratricopeptide (TPR) repeat protein
MLDLAEAILDRVHGPVLFLCLARPELLEQRPTWAAGKPHALTTTLPLLSPEDTRTIGELLLGPDVPSSVIQQVCETAEGNPLYLEQLSAMLSDQGLLEGGRWAGPDDAEVEIPASLQALLAARIDRLDAIPRLVLERAAIEGRRFRIEALRALSSELSLVEVEAAIVSLERSGLVEPEDEANGRWRFAHALVAEAAYRGLSKAERARLHEQLADWLEAEADPADVSESVARHLERALRLREELGLRDERSALLSLRAGSLFSASGLRAFAAVDLATTRDLLGRSAVLLPTDHPNRLEILPNLGIALTETGRADEGAAVLAEAVELSRAAGSERDLLRATIQLVSTQVYRSPTELELDTAVTEAERVMEAFEALGDDAGLAEAAIALEYLEFTRGRTARSHEWAVRALRHGLTVRSFRESAQAASDVVQTAAAGPLRFELFRGLAEEQLFRLSEPIADSAGHALIAMGSLAAGDAARFREDEQRWRASVERHGLGWLGAAQALVIAGVETSAGYPESAERRLHDARDVLAALEDVWWIQTLDSVLCAAVAEQDEPQRFLRLADAFNISPAVPDRQTLIRRNVLSSRALLLRGLATDAEAAARKALDLAQPTDLVSDQADALLRLAESLAARGMVDDADTVQATALRLLKEKGNLAAVSRLQVLQRQGR